MDAILLTLKIALMYSSPLVFTALGGVITQRSGVDNIGLEGMMTIGAFVGASVGYFTANPWFGFLAGGFSGAALASLHAIASINLRANQLISGIAMNFIGQGLALFLCRIYFNGGVQTISVPNKIPSLFSIFNIQSRNPSINALNIDASIIIAIILTVVMWFFFAKTKWGMRVTACGDHPAAADSLGINVFAVRYVCAILSGFLAGLGGAAMTLAVVSMFSATVISGHGFIALAAVIFGKWTPHGAFGACLLFGFAQSLVVMLGGLQFIPSSVLAMLPYILTLVVLALFVGQASMPKAIGKPYIKGQR
jgi:simple sugar transport system permease protein